MWSRKGFQFIGFPSEWGASNASNASLTVQESFQFIGFPSEWGALQGGSVVEHQPGVSNLLGSPASGETLIKGGGWVIILYCFQFIGFPSEWGEREYGQGKPLLSEFPIYWVPQRVGRGRRRRLHPVDSSFQFIGFPSEWGAVRGAVR